MPTNAQRPQNIFDLSDTVAYIITATATDAVTYQTPFGWHYDYQTEDTKAEIKVRTALYDELELPYKKVAELWLEKYNDEKLDRNYYYIFQCPVIPENKIYTVDLDTVMQCGYSEYKRPKYTVDGKKEWQTTLEYRIPLDKWKCEYCDCTRYWEYMDKGAAKYDIELPQNYKKEINQWKTNNSII